MTRNKLNTALNQYQRNTLGDANTMRALSGYSAVDTADKLDLWANGMDPLRNAEPSSLFSVEPTCDGHGSDLINGQCPDCVIESTEWSGGYRLRHVYPSSSDIVIQEFDSYDDAIIAAEKKAKCYAGNRSLLVTPDAFSFISAAGFWHRYYVDYSD